MSGASRGARKINIWGAPNQFTPEHPAGGFYSPTLPGRRDPYEGLSPRQRKIKKKEKSLNDWTKGAA